MPNKSQFTVSNPPSKPLLIWDGDCDFCRLWIERWREMTGNKVDYAAYQKVAARFAEIPSDQFTRSVILVEPNGKPFFAAEAVYRSLAYRRSREWLAWSYDHIPGFGAASETGYKLIASHRKFASAVTRLLWGKDVRRPTYFWPVVSAHTGRDLLDRIRVAMVPGRRTCRQRWDIACESIPARSSSATRIRCVQPVADAVLV